jgi:SAM-dependent methyltransferase
VHEPAGAQHTQVLGHGGLGDPELVPDHLGDGASAALTVGNPLERELVGGQDCAVADAIFEEPRLAAIYDAIDADRSDLAAYAALVNELGAHVVLDVGCGTGTFACQLAADGKDVIGIDPAAASLEVARRKPHAEKVRWLEGDATGLPPVRADIVTMTGNVAQVFLTDTEWMSVLAAARGALRPGRHLVFEVRDPAHRAWQHWTRAASTRRIVISDVGRVETWVELTAVRLPLVSFRHTFVFEADGATLASDSTLRFREKTEIAKSLQLAGFRLRDVRGAPDRPGLEFVFIAQRPVTSPPAGSSPLEG